MPPSQVAPLPRRAHAALLSATLALLGACAPGGRPATAPTPVARPDVPVETPSDLPAPSASAPLVVTDAPRPHEHLAGVTFDLDVHAFEDEERVQHYVRLFTGSARGTFTGWLARGTRYEPMIRAKLRAGGLPEDLLYLPLVESGYDANAVSRASAVGMWQFMAPTARDVGLRVDWWMDERRDPVRATDGAVKMLRWLKKEFGSYFVAAAAYNGGPTRVSRGLAQLTASSDSTLGDARFFALVDADYLRAETKNYVPQLIAAALVAKELPRYNLAVRGQAAFAYDSVTVAPLTPLAAVARAASASRTQLLDLNPQFLRGLTPPDARVQVRVPVGAAAGFAARYAKLDASTRRAFKQATTRKRETLEALAERQDVPLALLTAYNPSLTTVKTGKWKGRLVSGQAVRVPTAAVLEYGRAAADADDGNGAGALPALAPVEAPRVAERASPARSEKGDRGGKVEKGEKSETAATTRVATGETERDAKESKSEKDATPEKATKAATPAKGAEREGAKARAKADVPMLSLATVAREKPAKPAAKKTPAKTPAKKLATPATKPKVVSKTSKTSAAKTSAAKAKDAKAKDAKAKDAKAKDAKAKDAKAKDAKATSAKKRSAKSER